MGTLKLWVLIFIGFALGQVSEASPCSDYILSIDDKSIITSQKEAYLFVEEIEAFLGILKENLPEVEVEFIPGVDFDLYRNNKIETGPAKAGLAHEFGHHVWNHNLERVVPQWRQLQDINKELKNLENEIRVMVTDQISPKDPNFILKSARVQEILRQKVTSKLMRITLAYDELFADLIAVVAMEDFKAISRLMKGESKVNPADNQRKFGFVAPVSDPERYRDFSPGFEEADFVGSKEKHVQLGLVRSWLGAHVLTPEALRTRKSEILIRAFKAIGLEISRRLSDPRLWDLDPLEANKRLIIGLQGAFQGF